MPIWRKTCWFFRRKVKSHSLDKVHRWRAKKINKVSLSGSKEVEMMEIHLIKYTGKLRKPLIEKNSSNLSISNFFFENVEYFHEIFAKKYEKTHTINFVKMTFLHIHVKLLNNWFDEKNSKTSTCSAVCKVWKLQRKNSLSHFFRKNFLKAIFLLKKLPKNWFDENFFQWERIYRFSTLCCGTLEE